jgi:hypothetical protein
MVWSLQRQIQENATGLDIARVLSPWLFHLLID